MSNPLAPSFTFNRWKLHLFTHDKNMMEVLPILQSQTGRNGFCLNEWLLNQKILSTSFAFTSVYYNRVKQQLLPKQALFPPSAASRYRMWRCKYICLLPFVVLLALQMSSNKTDGPWHCTGFQGSIFPKIRGQTWNTVSTRLSPEGLS